MSALSLLLDVIHGQEGRLPALSVMSMAIRQQNCDNEAKESQSQNQNLIEVDRKKSVTALQLPGDTPNYKYARLSLVPEPVSTSEKAGRLVQQANQLLDGGLHRCKEWVTVKDLYFNAAALYQASDMHQEAGDAFNHSAAICRVYGSDIETATAASYAVESYRLVDPAQCNPLLQEMIDIYSRLDRIGLVAKYEHELAKNCEALGMDDDALQHYLLAVNACEVGENRKGGARGVHQQCKVKAARLSASLEKHREAAALFEQLAKEVIARGLGPTQYYFAATLCWLADSRGERFAGGLAKTKQLFLDYQDNDPHFQKGVENQFIRDLLGSFDRPSLSALDDAVRKYQTYRPNEDQWVGLLVSRIRDNLFQYLLPFM